MDLKNEIDAILKYIIASKTLLIFLNHPQHVAYFKEQFDDSNFEKEEDLARVVLSSNSGDPVAYLLHPALDYCRDNPEFNMDYMKRTLMININWIFEHLPRDKKYSFNKKSQKVSQKPYSREFEFFRHVRNACSHANTFNVQRSKDLWDYSNYSSEWNGFKIDLNLEGKECLFTFLTIGDVMQLLEFVRDNI